MTEPRGNTVHIDFVQPFVVVAIIAMMTGRLPFTPRTVGALLLASMFHVTADWKL